MELPYAQLTAWLLACATLQVVLQGGGRLVRPAVLHGLGCAARLQLELSAVLGCMPIWASIDLTTGTSRAGAPIKAWPTGTLSWTLEP